MYRREPDNICAVHVDLLRKEPERGGHERHYDALGQLFAEFSDGQTTPVASYPFTDILGSVRGVTDSTGALIEC